MAEPNPELDLLVTEIAELRPLPVVALRVLELAEGDRFSAHELAQTVSADQALTAKILRLSNSAYYGFPRRITTVRDAVVLLGFRAVRSATLASCVIETLPGGQVLDPVEAWRFSVSVGMLAEVLSRATREHVDEAFTAGVLHNIGRLAMDQQRPRELRQCIDIATARGWTIAQAERQVLGYTDAEVGGALALHRNFPPDLADAVLRHNLDPNALPDPQSRAAFVMRARMFARASGLTDGVEPPSTDAIPRRVDRPPAVSLPRADRRHRRHRRHREARRRLRGDRRLARVGFSRSRTVRSMPADAFADFCVALATLGALFVTVTLGSATLIVQTTRRRNQVLNSLRTKCSHVSSWYSPVCRSTRPP